jgi:hypothetical protein
MDTAVSFANAARTREPEGGGPMLGLASAVAFAAAGTALACSLLARKRRLSVLAQVCLGAVAGCAAVVTWQQRQQEMDAARHLIDHVHEVRDARWLKKHPVAYG